MGRISRVGRTMIAAALVAGVLTSPPGRADDGTLVEVVHVDARAGAGVVTSSTFEAGVEYLVVASGTYSLAPMVQADAECTARSADQALNHPSGFDYQPTRYGTGTSDMGDVFIDFREMPWRPAGAADANTCSPAHTYTARFRPTTYGRLNLLILDTVSTDNLGGVEVTIYRTPGPCAAVEGCEPPSVGIGGLLPDPPPPPTPPTVPTPSPPPLPALPPLPPVPLPPVGSPNPPPEPALTVDPGDRPPQRPAVSGQVIEVISLAADDPAGVQSQQVYQAGRTYEFIVEGAQAYAGVGGPMADAECSQAFGDATWSPDRFGPTELDVTLNGYEFVWLPLDETGSCDELTHAYRLTITASATGTVRFAIADSGNRSDNRGLFTVTALTRPVVLAAPNPLPHIPGNLVESLIVDSRDRLGTYGTLPLKNSRRYAVVVSGTWSWGGGSADAECSTAEGDLPRRDRFGADQLDLAVNGTTPDWRPTGPTAGEACDASGSYLTTFSTPAYPTWAWFGVWDALPGQHDDNAGTLLVSIYEVR